MSSFDVCDLDDHVGQLALTEPAWVQVAPGVEQPVEPPAFLLGDLPAEMTYAYFAESLTNPVRCYRLPQVKLTADGIVLSGGHALASTLLNHPPYHVAEVVGRLQPQFPQMPVRHIPGRSVMLSGPGSHIYGHWIIDILPRLFVLASCGHDLGALTYIVSASLPAYCHRYLDLLGIGEAQIIRHEEGSELLAVDEILLPSNLRRGSRLHPLMRSAVAFLRERISKRMEAVPQRRSNRRLYVSRRATDPSRVVQNRDAIEAIAQDAGYEIVQPELMSIPEQIALFDQATQIVGEYGSGLHGSIFAAPGTVVMALRGSSHHPGFIQSSLGQIWRQPTGYVLSATPIAAIDQSFPVSENAFRLGLRCAQLWERRAAGLWVDQQ